MQILSKHQIKQSLLSYLWKMINTSCELKVHIQTKHGILFIYFSVCGKSMTLN